MKLIRVLMLGDWGSGGILSHGRCLLACLREWEGYSREVDMLCIGEDVPYAGKRNGHDIRKFFQLRKIVEQYKPDVVHIQKMSLVGLLYLKFFTRIPRILSLHQPFGVGHLSFADRILFWLAQPCYFLPVSSVTWKGFKECYPKAEGEVFYNPIKLSASCVEHSATKTVIGMVGRNADQKDWPSFHKVCDFVNEERRMRNEERAEVWNLGEEEFCANAREKIGEMTVFVMTSKHEQLPTTMLECFLMKTPICGFIPAGGTTDVLQYSNGALKEVFIEERDCEKLAAIVKRLLDDELLRRRVVEDGWQILTKYFDAEKNCCGQLMDIYRRVSKW